MTGVQAIRVEQTGGPEVMTLQEVEVGSPDHGQVRVRIAAAGVNFIDIYRREGRYKMALPFTPGREGAGEVIEIGSGVEGVTVGDRVCWETIDGSYATEVIGSAAKLISVPTGVELEQAAAIPLQGITAHYLATNSYAIQPGDAVLIHAGAGGVGLLLTQIAKILGATVFTTVSDPDGEKGNVSRGAGSDEVFGYEGFHTRVRELTDGAGVAAVYDGVGSATFDGSLASLRRRGTMVLFGASSGAVPPFDPLRLMKGSLFLTRPTIDDFVETRPELLRRAGEVLGWLAGGKLDVRIGATYPLADAPQAHEDLAGRRTTGKLLLLP